MEHYIIYTDYITFKPYKFPDVALIWKSKEYHPAAGEVPFHTHFKA